MIYSQLEGPYVEFQNVRGVQNSFETYYTINQNR